MHVWYRISAVYVFKNIQIIHTQSLIFIKSVAWFASISTETDTSRHRFYYLENSSDISLDTHLFLIISGKATYPFLNC